MCTVRCTVHCEVVAPETEWAMGWGKDGVEWWKVFTSAPTVWAHGGEHGCSMASFYDLTLPWSENYACEGRRQAGERPSLQQCWVDKGRGEEQCGELPLLFLFPKASLSCMPFWSNLAMPQPLSAFTKVMGKVSWLSGSLAYVSVTGPGSSVPTWQIWSLGSQ